MKEDSEWSPDGTAYAYVKGFYTGLSFYEEYHYGVVIADPGVGQYARAYTEFRGYGSEPYTITYPLQPGEWKELTKHNSVMRVKTTTYSGYSEDPNLSTAVAYISIPEP
jgi:hypothetical protein